MNYISSDAIIKNAKHNIVLQNFNNDLQSKIHGTTRQPKDWFEEVSQENFVIPGLGNNINVEQDMSDYSKDKERIAPDVFVEMKSKKCPCGKLESRDNYVCYCDKDSEKTESGKPLEQFSSKTSDNQKKYLTLTFDKSDLYVIIVIILTLVLAWTAYNLYITNMKCIKLKLKYKKMKKELESNDDDD